ncbi:hypothetical protein SLS62_008414 [Diatrype stigma]|uniref:Uncharacterized protein n=1 Tax=Diatrype stigma TaxID=117547 RepID=A0AAN9ULR1_9PEZI
MDPLSITAGAIAMLELCGSILHICYNTRAILKAKSWGFSRIQEEVTGLRGVLEALFQLALDSEVETGHGHAPTMKLLAESHRGGLLNLCLDDLRALEEILLKKYTKEPRTKFHAVFRAVTWELSENEFKPYLDRLSRSKAALNLAVSANEASNVIRHLNLSVSEEKSPLHVAYFFCDFRKPKTLDIAVLLGGLISQLIVQRGSIPSEIEEAFQNSTALPHGLNETYDRILTGLSKEDQEIAQKILAWVSFAVIPLTMEELQIAIAIEWDDDHLDEESLLRSPLDILSLVSGLVNVSDNGYVSLAHKSVRDYLLSPETRSRPHVARFALSAEDSKAELFRSCMTYICFKEFRQGPSATSHGYIERLRQFPLLKHASIAWAYYYRGATRSKELHDTVLRFFADENRGAFMAWVQTINADNPFCWDFYPRHATSLYYAATFGLTEVVRDLVDRKVPLDSPGSRFGGTALHGAVYRSHIPVVETLLEAGADVNRVDYLGVSPLHTAATLGNLELIELLLRFSADAAVPDEMGETPCDWAEKSGQAKVRERLQGNNRGRGLARSAGNAAEGEDAQPDDDAVWVASRKTIPYFPDYHRHRSGMESSLIVAVQIGSRTVTATYDDPGPSPCKTT